MTSLTESPISPLLDRLFNEAHAQNTELSSRISTVPPEERARLMRSKTDYRELYRRLNSFALPVSRETGALLYMLARSTNAHTIVEFGTSFGVSTVHLGAALRDNEKQKPSSEPRRLITTEFEAGKAARARENLTAAKLIDLVELREGDALETLARDLPKVIDLVLLDGAKSLYLDVLALLEPRLRVGAFVIADNADHCPEYLARVREPGSGYLSVPFAEDIELTMRLG